MLTHTDRGENLTHDLDVDVSAVSHVLDLHRQGVRSGVSSLCRADEEDGVHIAGTGPHSLVLHEDAVLKPGHDGTGLSLQIKKHFPHFLNARNAATVQSLSLFVKSPELEHDDELTQNRLNI